MNPPLPRQLVPPLDVPLLAGGRFGADVVTIAESSTG